MVDSLRYVFVGQEEFLLDCGMMVKFELQRTQRGR